MSLFASLNKCISFVESEFKNRHLATIINYFKNSYNDEEFRDYLFESLFNYLFSDWLKDIKSNNVLDETCDINVLIKKTVSRYSLKALNKYNHSIVKNNLSMLPIIALSKDDKKQILIHYSEVISVLIDSNTVKTNNDIIIQFKSTIKSFFSMFYDKIIFDIKHFFTKTFTEENINEKLLEFEQFLKNISPDSDSEDESDNNNKYSNSAKRKNDNTNISNSNTTEYKRPKK